MSKRRVHSRWLIIPSIAFALALVVFQFSIAIAQAPQPNPLAPVPPGNPIFAPVPGVNIFANGPAASIHGDPAKGRVLFAENCVTCHNDRGIGGIPNPGSDDGTVPSLNPIDPGFLADSNGDPTIFARDIDLFVQHGSRPAGPDPQLSMIGWGDHKLLTQQQLADIEAYVMQLNGVYWPDRWAPPAEVRMDATRDGNTITYQITLVNHGSSTLGNLDLKDTLPPGLVYVTSYIPGPGQNPGQVTGNTVEWINLTGVPQGGTLGPFVIVAQAQGAPLLPNVAQLFFTWAAWDGTTYSSSAVSEPTLPGQHRALRPFSLTPLPTNTATPLPMAMPTLSASPVAPTATPTTAPAPGGATIPTATPTTAAATATPLPPTPTAAPVTATPATFSVQIVQPSAGALSWGYSPASITVHVGDTVTWTNAGTVGHTVTADDGSFDSGMLDVGASWSYTFNSPGTFAYHCTPHPWMKGTVVVLPTGQ